MLFNESKHTHDKLTVEWLALQIAAIVTQPNRPKGRGNKKVAQPSPVAQLALDQGWPQEKILSPVKASEVQILPVAAPLST